MLKNITEMELDDLRHNRASIHNPCHSCYFLEKSGEWCGKFNKKIETISLCSYVIKYPVDK